MPVDFRSLFVDDVPLLDVRAPVEFEKGAFPTAINIPILNDDEREAVGKSYRHDGPDAAVELGYNLVSGARKEARINEWRAFIDANPNTHLYCFRGGQRSAIAWQWLKESGIDIPRIEGGYKALRQFLLSTLDTLPDLALIAGKTGVGKTEVLAQLSGAIDTIDLEHLANHRGSAFGKHVTEQPAQISFENALAIQFLKAGNLVVVEDESRMIGRINLPLPLQERMKASPVFVLEDAMENRVARIADEYIVGMRLEFLNEGHSPDSAATAHRDLFITAIDAIRKRLGGVHHGEIRKELIAAFETGSDTDVSRHYGWIEKMLLHYYDPMYEYQLAQKADRIRATGPAETVTGAVTGLLCDR